MPVGFLFFPVLMGVLGYIIMKILVFDLVDEVYDCGDHLRVVNRGQERLIDLKDIININSSVMTNPRRVTLSVRGPTGIEEISFAPPSVWSPFGSNPLVKDLITRVDEARRKAN